VTKSVTFKILLLLAAVQAVAGMLRGFNWIHIGGDLFSEGLLLLPIVGAIAVLRGLFIAAVALLYVLFVVGSLLEKSWARWCCLIAVIINLLFVLSALAQGAPVSEAIAWSAIPVILLFEILSQTGRDLLKAPKHPAKTRS